MTHQERPIWAVRLESERIGRGWGKWQTARRLLEAKGDPAPSTEQVKGTARQITGHERGRVYPADWGLLYAIVYGTTAEDLFGTAHYGRVPAQLIPIGDAPGITGVTVDPSSTPGKGDDDVKRRATLQLIAALGAGAAVPPGVLEDLLSGIDGVLGTTTDVDEWERIVHDYGHQVYRRPFDLLIPAVVADIVAVGELLRKGRPPHEQVGLLRVSAGLSGVLAETLGNMGDDRAARRSWNTARRAADASGDRRLRVWVRGRAAQNATWAGSSHRTVMTMVNDAHGIADGAPSPGLARACAAGAYVAALHGDRETAHGSLDKLKHTYDRLPHDSSEPTVLDFHENQLLWNEAYVRVAFAEKGAPEAIDSARARYPSTAVAPVVNLHLMRTINLIDAGEVREALDLAVGSLTGRPRPVMATRQLVDQILASLPGTAHDLPAARDLRALTAPQSPGPPV